MSIPTLSSSPVDLGLLPGVNDDRIGWRYMHRGADTNIADQQTM
jgi:hypothetical protein